MPTASVASSREILTGLHEVMASKASAQAKLNKVVKTIAEAMASEVCSIYLLRDGELELFATFGLNQSAVHVTRLALGEGLVGTIAKDVAVLNLAEAASHPEFAYRPETGEELFHSFAGVPIIRKERAIGVLAVQHAEPRAYDEIEIEALQTVAMVLSELIANAGLADKAVAAAAENRESGMARLAGQRRARRVRSLQTEAGRLAVDQTRVQPAQRLVVHLQPVRDAGAEILDDNIGYLDQVAHDFLAFGATQIEAEALFAAVVLHPVGALLAHPGTVVAGLLAAESPPLWPR
mgnify:CR=1 FL=1